MKIQFDSSQSYQLEAIKSVTDIFEGQPLSGSPFEFSLSAQNETDGQIAADWSLSLFGNKLLINDDTILKNANKIQSRNGIEISPSLQGKNFTVEMETGTGKTYVYIRTIYELNKLYGFKKFVIVVPSVAIRAGVLKNLEITHEHLQDLYERQPTQFQMYDSQKLSGLRSFSTTDSIQILVINIDSFAKDENVINKPNDNLSGRTPIEFIQATQPIVIVDEPQNMETEKRKKAVSNLNPLCTLRYSATHRDFYNLVYKLDPIKAYELKLVKQIEVTSVLTKDSHNEAYIKLESFPKTKKQSIEAKITIDCKTLHGVSRTLHVVRSGSNLYDLSGHRDVYEGYRVTSIERDEYIEFENGVRIDLGQTLGGYTEDIMKNQIKKTIEKHFEKELKNKALGIKTLSIFFIDRVSNYRQYDEQGSDAKGKFALWFEELFNEINAKTKLYTFTAEQVHNGYFSQDKKGKLKDSNEERSNKEDESTFALIMQHKEKLLDMNEPLRFIFSHSALREGWDNPNVFQICTLNETKSDNRKRQEIGRGLRLCVNSDGKRTNENGEIYGRDINRLTIVANDSYESFCSDMQSKLKEEGLTFKKEMYENADDKKDTIKLKENYELDQNFKELWERIKQKTRYKVKYDTEELIKSAAEMIQNMPETTRPSIITRTNRLDKITEYGFESTTVSEAVTKYLDYKFEIPDFLTYIESKTQLTRKTISEILKQSHKEKDILKNPQMFMDNAVVQIKKALQELIVKGIEYEKIEEYYDQELFNETNGIELLVEILNQRYKKVNNQEKTLYNYVETDSKIEKEFAEKCENIEEIPFYLKLPKSFKIRTPIGNYSPDWALIRKDESKVYFVAETKGDPENLRGDEAIKVNCGKKHFEKYKLQNVEYQVVKDFKELVK